MAQYSPPVTANGGPYFGELIGATLKTVVTYTLNNHNQLGIQYQATDESPNLNTVVNLTNHSYYNLQGEDAPAGSAYGQYLQINADTYTPTDTTEIPTGVEAPVAGTPFDFTRPHTIGSRIEDVSAPDNAATPPNQLLIAQGYDHNWVLNPQTSYTTGPDGLNLAARAFDPVSGRALTVWTDQPGVQVYTSNFLNGTLVGISGHADRTSGPLRRRSTRAAERAWHTLPSCRTSGCCARARCMLR